MAEIQPFRAFRFDPKRVALQSVLTQPYDKITPAMQDRYYAASPFNLIAIEKGRVQPGDSTADSVYTRASAKMREWIGSKILVQDSEPSVYVYSQEFLDPASQMRRTRTGFIALTRLYDYADRVIFRHERTLSAPKADRIELLRQTHAQTGQLFLLYDDPSLQIDRWLDEYSSTRAALQMTDEYNVIHRFWPAPDPQFIERIGAAMEDKKLIIADGHHRYETALHLRNEFRKSAGGPDPFAASEFAMATFVNAKSPGLVILPTHRLVSNLANFDFERFQESLRAYFDSDSYPFKDESSRAAALAEFRKDLVNVRHGNRAIGIYPDVRSGERAFYLVSLRRDADLQSLLPDYTEAQRGLNVVLLHRVILEKCLGITPEAVAGEKNIAYERESDSALAAVDRGQAQIAFLLNSVRMEQVEEIALAGDVLPQKSTDFYPKLLSGIAIYQLEGRVGARYEHAVEAK